MDDMLTLEKKFHAAMLELYKMAKNECDYCATRFLLMVNERGGLEAAKTLIRAKDVSEGFKRLWECERLDLTVEAKILEPEWHPLFSDDDREVARKRLRDLGYKIK